MLVFVLNQTQKANTGKIQTPVYENVREFGTYPRNTLRLRPLKSVYSRAFFGITDGRTSSIILLMITGKALVFLYAQK